MLARSLVGGRRVRPRRRRRRRARGHRGGARVRRRGRGGHALREPHAARRRHVLGRARRPLARQRPAHRAALLHRLPRASSTGSAWPSSRRCSARLRVPVLREGKPRGVHLAQRHARAAPPRLLAPALPAAHRRASASRRSAPRSRCASSTPTTRRSTSRRSATGCARTARARPRSTALWNLIALPTLNLHADEASLGAAVKVFRTGLLDAARRRRHRASRPCRSSGCTATPRRPRSKRAGARVAARHAGRRGRAPAIELQLDDGTDGRRRGRRRRAAPGRREARAAGRRRRGGDRGARHEPDREPARALRPARARRAVRGRASARRCSGSSTAPARRASPRASCVAVSLSGSRRRDRRAGRRAARALPARARAPASRGARRDGARLHRHPRAARDLPRRARQPPPAPRHAHVACPASTSPARGPTPGWPATMEGAVRSGLAAAAPRSTTSPPDGSARRSSRGRRGMTRHRHLAPDAAARRGARPRAHAPALAPAPRRLVEGRARDERDDRRRGSLPAPLPRPRRRRRDRGDGALDPLASSAATARGRPSTAGAGDLSTTVEAYVALRLAGDPADAAHMRCAAAFVRDGGRHRALARVHAHVALAALALVVGRRCRRSRPS